MKNYKFSTISVCINETVKTFSVNQRETKVIKGNLCWSKHTQIQLSIPRQTRSYFVHGKILTQATWFIPWKFKSKIYTYINFQQCNFRPQKTKQKNAENKFEIKHFFFKKCIYCVYVKYRWSPSLLILSERKINRKDKIKNPQIIHYSSQLFCALACGVVGF